MPGRWISLLSWCSLCLCGSSNSAVVLEPNTLIGERQSRTQRGGERSFHAYCRAAHNSLPAFCAVRTAAQRFEDCRSVRTASATVRQSGEGAQLATASVGTDSARRVVRIAKERIVCESAYPICIHLSSCHFWPRSDLPRRTFRGGRWPAPDGIGINY